MKVGFLTACMRDVPIEDIIKWSGESGVERLEILWTHLGDDSPDRDSAIRALLDGSGVGLSGVAHYDARLLDDPGAAAAALKTSVDRCVRLGTDVLCSLTGLPPVGMSKEDAIDGPVADIFGPVAEYAQSKG